MVFNLETLDVRSTLLLNALFAILTASLYTFVGARIDKRQVSPESLLAAKMFAVWWYGLAAITLSAAVQSILGAANVRDLALFVTMSHVTIIVLCVALAGLVYYLLFLFTGQRGIIVPISLFYVFVYVILVAYVTYSEPAAVKIERWETSIQYANQVDGGPFVLALLAVIIVPVLLGAIAYLSLLFRVRDRAQRYRIGLVAGALTVWFSASLVASLVGLTQEEWWQVVSRLLGIMAAVGILWAYDPPRWIQRILGAPSSAQS